MKINKAWLILIVILAFLVRLYKIDSPIADWHSWRQADTAAVTRNFIKEGFNPFLPKYDDTSGVAEAPYPNLARYRFVEFPVYNIAVYPLYLVFGVQEWLHRLVSVIFSVGSLVFLYLIVRKYASVAVAYLAALVFAFLPFNIFFSRTTLPEPTFVFFALGMIFFVDRWIWEGRKFLWWAGFFTALSFLIKPWAIFYLLPLGAVYYKKNGKLISKKLLLFLFLSLLPFILWRLWILQSPEGIPASNWLLNGDGIRFRPAFWWWIISERIGREILGVTGAFLFFLGLLIRPKDGNFFLHLWALAMFLYFVVFATGNVRHDYYQIIFVPVASVFASIGFVYLIKGSANFVSRFWSFFSAVLFFSLMFYFSWTQVKELYKINNPPIIEAGKKADQLLPQNAVVVAPYSGDTAFLYQIDRPGWPVVAFPFAEMVANFGVTHLVSVAKDGQTKWAMRHFTVLEETPNYVIVDLTKIKKEFSKDDPEP